MSDEHPCAEWSDRLSFATDDLSPSEVRALADHLEDCPGCRREQARAQAVRSLLLAGDPATTMRTQRSRAMRADLLERCKVEAPRPAARTPRWPALLRWALLPVAAASALGAWTLVRRPVANPAGPTASPHGAEARHTAPATGVTHRPTAIAETVRRKPAPPGNARRLAAGPSREIVPVHAGGGVRQPQVRRAVPGPRLASHPARPRRAPQITPEILVLEASSDRGVASPPPPLRIAMGSESGRSGEIAVGTTTRRP